MEEILLNGDVYIKIVPDLVTRYKVTDNRPETKIIIDGKVYDKSTLTDDVIESLSKETQELLEGFGIIRKEKGYNNNHNGFYQIWIGNGVYTMLNWKEKEAFQYRDIKDVKNKYINLRDYLSKAKYVGIYLQNADKPILEFLASYNNVNLMRNTETCEYLIIASNNPVLEGYYPGELLKSTFDEKKTYQAIISQLIKRDYPEENQRK